jgi:hypothetical protein
MDGIMELFHLAEALEPLKDGTSMFLELSQQIQQQSESLLIQELLMRLQ